MTTNPRTLASLTKEARRKAGRSHVSETITALCGLEASLREEARLKYALGLDPTILVVRVAHIAKAIDLLHLHILQKD
jgi:hypothetical protein